MTAKRKIKKLFILVSLVSVACNGNLPTLNGIDLKTWAADKNGCKHVREKSINALTAQIDKLKTLDETQIAQLLGRPDQTELYKRNQKFYTYFLEPSAKCSPSNQKAKKLIVRFNGTRVAREVEIK
jgi:outer membrane protein assembly factor BamE (lipoprotein component of BamABCDE complex)